MLLLMRRIVINSISFNVLDDSQYLFWDTLLKTNYSISFIPSPLANFCRVQMIGFALPVSIRLKTP